jgi:hypothetical protein
MCAKVEGSLRGTMRAPILKAPSVNMTEASACTIPAAQPSLNGIWSQVLRVRDD